MKAVPENRAQEEVKVLNTYRLLNAECTCHSNTYAYIHSKIYPALDSKWSKWFRCLEIFKLLFIVNFCLFYIFNWNNCTVLLGGTSYDSSFSYKVLAVGYLTKIWYKIDTNLRGFISLEFKFPIKLNSKPFLDPPGKWNANPMTISVNPRGVILSSCGRRLVLQKSLHQSKSALIP